MCTCGCAQLLGECNHVAAPRPATSATSSARPSPPAPPMNRFSTSFAAKYGATVLAAPTTHGFDLVAWIAPFAVFAAALLGTILLVRHWSVGRLDCAAAQAADPAMNALREKIRRETGRTEALTYDRNPGTHCRPAARLALVIYTFWPENVFASQREKTRLEYLLERKEQLYENLRDLNFEYRAGKYPEEDFVAQRDLLEHEAAQLLAEIEFLQQHA